MPEEKEMIMAMRKFIIERDIPKVGTFEREQLRAAAAMRMRDLVPGARVGGSGGDRRRREDDRAPSAAHLPAKDRVTTISSCSATSLRGNRQVDAASSTQCPRRSLTTVDKRTRA